MASAQWDVQVGGVWVEPAGHDPCHEQRRGSEDEENFHDIILLAGNAILSFVSTPALRSQLFHEKRVGEY